MNKREREREAAAWFIVRRRSQDGGQKKDTEKDNARKTSVEPKEKLGKNQVTLVAKGVLFGSTFL